MGRKLLVVTNPTSGGRKKNQKLLCELTAFITANELEVEIYPTTPDQNACQIIEGNLDDSYSDLVAVGGDGTINEAVNGLKYDIPLTIIPAGTGNDFVKNVPIGETIQDQFQVLIKDTTMSIDLGICNDRKFANGIGVGFDGQIVEDMNGKKVPFLKGHAKYYYHVLQILASYKPRDFKYTQDGESFEQSLILMTIGNGTTYGGGFNLMPDAKVNDGLLDICTIGPLAPIKRFLNIEKLSNGTHGSLDKVNFHQVKSVTIKENPLLFAHADGEQIGKPPFDIKVLPNALKLRI
ncbi:MAG: diacylglycerol kinase family lipid kinase [Cytophagales bacterium]|nr:diacylglycerol kinase family lipid kinase [Cytophagales bacterium]